ncbi:hypothetical protein [Phascolarctobacterium sp.]|uniref:hypothetical protein n=1 Tax=Phascolarctobacterium sp. TaxID=2049039 RepID=UPI00386A98AB
MDNTQREKYAWFICSQLDRRTLLEQLAEEAAELSQAALKAIRAEQLNNNVTEVDLQEAKNNVVEEIRDVLIVASMVTGWGDWENSYKWERWAVRLMKNAED